ncbi:histidine phosphatase family protein [Piscinibacter terrae]|uniref:Histidine phosphatase family protein n=1 Tax=Piscinibacter terrae TaxID=2496871 RepID=A0A3N7JT24_9BURK|nr:histidine phosphatase family protein [Albitalea terrae]RQP22135.1 histidine phosphatase family protein [Albitalea terrae]
MRHGSVDYFRADGSPVHPHTVQLNAAGREQADAAGALFKQCGVRFDRVIVSGLNRTVETAERVLAASGQSLTLESMAALEEIRGGRLVDIPPDQVEAAFLGAFTQGVETQRFLGGESIGEMLDRVLPAFESVLARDDWSSLLLVLHGGVNRALLARAMTGGRAFFGRMEQLPACINIVDVDRSGDMVVRSVNLAPTQWLHQHESLTTMEKLLAQYLRLT